MEARSIQGNGSVSAQSSAPVSSQQGGSGNPLMNGVGKSDFLKLLVAQLRNQDPMKPMEDKEFISQMAQLNTVEQITAMNNQLTEFLNAEAILQASSLIGKTVEATPEDGTMIAGIVQEIRLEQGKPVLIVDGKKLSLIDIQKISPGK